MILAEFTQLLGGIGVIASLIYVAIQIRNNSRAVRAAAYQQLSASIAGLWAELGRNQELCAFALRGSDDFSALTRIEKARYRFFLMSFLRNIENGWFQHRIGTLKEEDWQTIAADLDSLFTTPGARAAWPFVQNRSNINFRAYVDAV